MAQDIGIDADKEKQLAKKLKEILAMTPTQYEKNDPIMWLQLKKIKEFNDMEKPDDWTSKFLEKENYLYKKLY